MATNVIKKGGLRLKEARVDQALMTCVHDVNDTVPLGIGDAVKTSNVGGQTVTNVNGPYTKTVARVAAGDKIFGVVEAALPQMVATGQDLSKRYAPASTSMYVLVRPANHQDVYAITEDGTLSVANIGYHANLTGNGGGTSMTNCDTTTGQSTMMLDTSTADASTTTLQVNLIGYEDTVDNNPGVLNSSILVLLSSIEQDNGVAGI